MPRGEPLYTSANGINRLLMLVRNRNRTPQNPSEWISIEENSWEFTLLASAVNIGIEILEAAEGRRTLERLGCLIVQEWHRTRRYQFGGNIHLMRDYVEHFLSALRADFPTIQIGDLGNPDCLGATERITGVWDGVLTRFKPKLAVIVTFNKERVANMVEAAKRSNVRTAGQGQPEPTSRPLDRHKNFQFMFAATAAHELCHAFVAYLSGGRDTDYSYTPPTVSHLDLGYTVPHGEEDQSTGESGRWFENALFGGSLEFYRNPQDDDRQASFSPGLSSNLPEVLTRIGRDSLWFVFPLATVGTGVTARQRAERGIRSLGSTQARGVLPAGTANLRYMQAQGRRSTGPFRMYNVSAQELRRIPTDPRPLRAVRVA
ncbi:hypothetical protein EDB81DRAFT_700945 [Dactylonectria macrodidyma]|uniref:Uncharacterized protein n=1 Tax=Dactylonectria macrodidyma TaxID=307937 RepID=A0A9P9DKJ7_9HYPO|nr:hypothetical protein EDB81DRAFT_700945 [Dactylonectria macrodidyma]